MDNLWIDQASSLDSSFVAAAIVLLFCILSFFICPQEKARTKKKKSQRDMINTFVVLSLILSFAFLVHHTYHGTNRQIEDYFGIGSLTSETTPYCTPFSRVVDTDAQWKEGAYWFQGRLIVEKREDQCEVSIVAFENPQSKLLETKDTRILTSDS